MANLANRTFEPTYTSTGNDVIKEFYIPALSSCSNYDRVSAYFDSGILRMYAQGLQCIRAKQGKVRFIFSEQLSEEDFTLMANGYQNREKLESEALSRLDKLPDSPLIYNLAYLIASGIVEIKIAFKRPGIFHDKFGLIYDDDQNILYFRGSNNETAAAVQNNFESFETSCSWLGHSEENKKIQIAKTMFEQMWKNQIPGINVIDIPKCLEERLLVFNKGHLVIDEKAYYKNALILDYDSASFRLVGINQLDNNVLVPTNILFKQFVEPYLGSIRQNNLIFKQDLYLHQIRKVIDGVSRIGKAYHFDVLVSARLQTYMDNQDIKIEKRRKLGILIKNKDSFVLNDFEKFSKIVSRDLSRPLRLPQMWNSFHMVHMIRSANFSVPGAGKTSMVYGAFAYLSSKEINKIDRIVMVGPKNSFMAWKDEFKANFGNKKMLRLFDIQDQPQLAKSKRQYNLRHQGKSCNLILMNYDSLKGYSSVLSEIIDERTLLVFDEVHKIKSITGVTASYALKISRIPKYKVVLTGTPIPNSYLDIFNFLHILYREDYENFFRFDPSFLKEAKVNPLKQKQINESIYPFYCRTTKMELEVPPPNPDDITTGFTLMTESEQKIFELVYQKFSFSILGLYIRLLQAATNPKMILRSISEQDLDMLDYSDIDGDDEDEYDPFKSRKVLENSKIEPKFSSDEIALLSSVSMTGKFWKGIDIVETLCGQGKKVIVWAVFLDTLSNIHSVLYDKNITSKIISGSLPLADREQAIKDFNEGKFQVIIANPQTLAESVSLHKVCHDAIYFEYSFNLTHMLQSRDRIHRLGLPIDQYTQYFYLFLDSPSLYNSVDKKTYARLKEKERIMIRAVEGTNLILTPEDIDEDLKAILGAVKK